MATTIEADETDATETSLMAVSSRMMKRMPTTTKGVSGL
jgi:hypothetical protein